MKSPKSASSRKWSYGRAFFLTTGLAFLGLMVLVWTVQGHMSNDWPASAWVLFGGIISVGILSCGFAIAGSNRAIQKWFASCGIDEGAIIVAVIAAPVYWIGQLFEKPRRKR